MTEVIVTKSIHVPASAAWEKLSSFRGIENYSPIEKSVTEGQGAGATRTCYLPDGAAIQEILNTVEDNKMEMEYKITEGPFPIDKYTSTIKVSAVQNQECKITWGCEFECTPEVEAEMTNMFSGFYNVIIDQLENFIKNEN